MMEKLCKEEVSSFSGDFRWFLSLREGICDRDLHLQPNSLGLAIEMKRKTQKSTQRFQSVQNFKQISCSSCCEFLADNLSQILTLSASNLELDIRRSQNHVHSRFAAKLKLNISSQNVSICFFCSARKLSRFRSSNYAQGYF